MSASGKNPQPQPFIRGNPQQPPPRNPNPPQPQPVQVLGFNPQMMNPQNPPPRNPQNPPQVDPLTSLNLSINKLNSNIEQLVSLNELKSQPLFKSNDPQSYFEFGGINQNIEALSILNVDKAISQLSNEKYKLYLDVIRFLNTYIMQKWGTDQEIDFKEFKKYYPTFDFLEYAYPKQYQNIQEYNEFIKIGGVNFIDLDTLLLVPYEKKQVYDPKKLEVQPITKPTEIKNLVPGTQNLIFVKLENQKKNNYEKDIGDYTRIDFNIPVCKLRFDPKVPNAPFIVYQEKDGKMKSVKFSTLQEAKNFCCNGGNYYDLIMNKVNENYNEYLGVIKKPNIRIIF